MRTHPRARELATLGIEARICDRNACLAIEPALAAQSATLAGGLYAPGDESGDAFRFTQTLGAHVAAQGATLYWDTTIVRLRTSRDRDDVDGIDVRTADGALETLRADAYVVCLGSYGPQLLKAVGERLPIYPVKGYSITAPVADAARAPSVSLTDESRRIVCSRLGSRLRIAGTAELNGFDTQVRPERIAGILEWAQSRFPGAIDAERAEHWAGLRPTTPGNVPLIGRGRRANLWLNTGHGTLGWTLSCGSAAALAELMCGRRPAVEFPFLAA